MENLENGLQKETPESFINPMFEIQVDYKNEAGNRELLTKQPFMFIMNQYLKDYFFGKNLMSLNDEIIITLRLAPGTEIKMPLFLKSIPANWAYGQEIPGGVLYENKPSA